MVLALFSPATTSSSLSIGLPSDALSKGSRLWNKFPARADALWGRKCGGRRQGGRWGLLVRPSASSDGRGSEGGEDRDKPAFNPFGFVTDNPSSRSAIQLPETPAEDGNVGQMLYRIEDKGKEYGSYIKSGKFVWFVRETGSSASRRGTIIFIHGAPTQSYSYRVVMSQMADAGFHCFAPDWIGFGFSDKPQPGYGFDYTEKEFHEEFDRLLAVLNVDSPFILVTQGFLVGSYGLTWALNNSTRVAKLVVLNSPVTPSSPLPGLFQQLRFNSLLNDSFLMHAVPMDILECFSIMQQILWVKLEKPLNYDSLARSAAINLDQPRSANSG